MNETGADGLEEGAGRAFLLARGWPEFAQQVVQILTDDVLRRKLELEAIQLADRLFSMEATFAELGQALADATWRSFRDRRRCLRNAFTECCGLYE